MVTVMVRVRIGVRVRVRVRLRVGAGVRVHRVRVGVGVRVSVRVRVTVTVPPVRPRLSVRSVSARPCPSVPVRTCPLPSDRRVQTDTDSSCPVRPRLFVRPSVPVRARPCPSVPVRPRR